MSARWLTVAASIWCTMLVSCPIPRSAQAQTTGVVPAPPPKPPGAQGQSSAASPSVPGASPLERRITLELHDVSLDTALQEIAARTGVRLIYSARVVPLARRVSARVENGTVRDALDDVLEGVNVEVKVSGDRIVLNRGSTPSRTSDAAADSAVGWIYGRVSDSVTSRPLAGAVVSVKGTAISMVANEQGSYVLARVPAGVHTITVRLLGYAYVERQVALADSQRLREDFALRMSMSRLPEVVTTATGERRRLELGNDIVRINADSIARTEPVTSVTDLLEGRVPGLVVQRTSGAPGDPARLRLRGAASAYLSNDPIVIVDGIRVYAAQSDTRSANLAWNPDDAADFTKYGVATPSPLDYLDPHSIETIEVMKGPSAATLYGADAANGVIVITTKRGQAGPPRWTASAERGTTYIPGSYPDSYLRWGHRTWDPGTAVICPLPDLSCVGDSVSHFQALNDPALTILGHGERTAFTLGVSGGVDALQYSINGNYSDELGIVRLPGLEADRYAALHAGTRPPDWMRRPQRLEQWGASSRLMAKLGTRADVGLTSMLSRTAQQRSTLESRLRSLMMTYIDPVTQTYYRPVLNVLQPTPELLTDYQRRLTSEATQFTNSANLNWRPRAWLTTSADLGLNVIEREDAMLLPRLAVASTEDSLGAAALARARSLVSTVNVRASATAPLPLGLRLQTAVGVNYTRQQTADLTTSVQGLNTGATSVGGGITPLPPVEAQEEASTFGWYIEPTLSHKRFWLSTGLRMDGGNTFGSRASLAHFPKVSLSYLISDEPFFPLKHVIDLLRLRVAYGQAGVQPGPKDRLRLYTNPSLGWADGHYVNGVELSTLGNTKIRPERSTEIEGGFDADLLDDRVSVGVTGYRKTRVDALMTVPLPPSVYGDVSVLQNIGVVRNTGYEVTLSTQLVRSDLVTWGTQVNVSHNENVVVKLGSGVLPFDGPSGRVAPGYPINGRWAKPVLGYSDANGNGILDPTEILYGDTAVYMGRQEPDYTAALSTTISLFRGTVSVSGGLAYEHGLTQTAPWKDMRTVLRAYNDPTAPLDLQAAAVSSSTSDYLAIQTVNVLRFSSLAVAYNVPAHIARRAGARALTVSVQGTNLGLRTNYRGKDPSVNAFPTGDRVMDIGVIPQPRSWQLRVSASY
jgi:TonB-linked SusC/RagA family outer membrane protein